MTFRNEVLNCDCMDFLKSCKDKEFSLAIIDPPYGIGESGKKNKSRSKLAEAVDYKMMYGEDKTSPSVEYFQELFRVSEYQIIFGANHFISKIPIDASCWIVWDKDNGGTSFADCELAWTNFRCSVKRFKYTWAGMRQEKMGKKEVRIHPTQKPVDLYKWILRVFTNPDYSILDTHVGSGSSRIACYDMGFNFVGCELDEHYFNAQEERFKNHTRQNELFSMRGGAIHE